MKPRPFVQQLFHEKKKAQREQAKKEPPVQEQPTPAKTPAKIKFSDVKEWLIIAFSWALGFMFLGAIFFSAVGYCYQTVFGVKHDTIYIDKVKAVTPLMSNVASVREVNYSADDDEVYICTGGSSKRYHYDPDCRGLSRCTGDIEAISISEAEDIGRTPCRLCE